MLLTGAILAILSLGGFSLTFTRLPEAAKRWIMDHPLYADVGGTWATYAVLGKTLTALIAAGFVSCGLSLILFVPMIMRKIKARKANNMSKDKPETSFAKFKRMLNRLRRVKPTVYPKTPKVILLPETI